MAYTAVTYTFTNGTTADASQVNSNFTDLVNGLSDGTKDLNVSAITAAGNVQFNGTVGLGNATGDDITITGSLASSIPIKTTNSYDIGTTTLGLRAIFYGANTKVIKIQASSSMSADWTWTWPVTAGTDGYYLKTSGAGVTSWQAFTTPTIQTFLSGSGTYTTPSNVKYIRVKMVGSGAGGTGSGTAAGTAAGAGNTSTFGTSLLTCTGGTTTYYSVGAGTISAPAIGTTYSGGTANHGLIGVATNPGGCGGNSFLGEGGQSGSSGAGAATKGGGGAGGYIAGAGTVNPSGGTGGGGVDAIITNPSATYAYAVGAAGTAGGAGTSGGAGGAGAAGYIEVTEYYS